MKLRTGQIVAIEFSDHVEAGSTPLRFIVYGRLSSVTRRALVIDSWRYSDSQYRHDKNEVRFTIVRSAIHSVTQLRPVKVHPEG